ncbi:MAG: FAD:protein FMN transferase, partial [Betaproteobacteria bacterium]|nr:FAD:protein FMN transferase [Betaproteobacteria bacterium]
MNTQRRQWLRWGSGVFAAGLTGQGAFAGVSDPQLVWRERALIGFGTTLWLRAAHHNTDQLELALNDAVKAIRSVEADMSLFNPDSAVSRLNRDGVLQKPSAQLLSVLSLAHHVSARSQGAFDVTVQPLWSVWSQAQAADALPDRKQLQLQRKLVNWRALEAHTDTVRLNVKGMGVSLNGIAQGYAADLVRAVLQSHGVMHAMIDTGETATLGNAPGDKPWRFGVESAAKPNAKQAVMTADGRAMATSSDAHTAFTPDHVHHHIFNPHTGDS